MSHLQEIDTAYVAGTYKRFPVEITSGRGSIVCDTAGKQYIDMGSGIGVTAFGIADEGWMGAVTRQLSLVQHMSNLYYTEPCARLAEHICTRTGMKKVFFCNSGAEANEGAIKVARKYAAEKKGPECYTIVTLKNSFHGRTLTTLAATGQDHFHTLFQPLTPGFCHIEANNIDELKEITARADISGILIECVQGEGGVNVLTKEFVQTAAQIAREKDIILMVDEVQTGNGRTGQLYSYMHYGITPDIVSTAKGIGGGLPLGAVILGEKVENVLGYGDHGSTFGGNPVCCAGALHILERMDDAFLSDVERKGRMVTDALTGQPGIESVSGMGLMIGIKTVKPAAEVLRACMERGVLCLTAKDKIRLLPALNIPDEVLMEAVSVLLAVCAE